MTAEILAFETKDARMDRLRELEPQPQPAKVVPETAPVSPGAIVGTDIVKFFSDAHRSGAVTIFEPSEKEGFTLPDDQQTSAYAQRRAFARQALGMCLNFGALAVMVARGEIPTETFKPLVELLLQMNGTGELPAAIQQFAVQHKLIPGAPDNPA